MNLTTILAGKTFSFSSVKEVLAKANEQRSGDTLAGIAAESDLERIAAKAVLSNLLVSDLRENPVVPYEEDEVTRLNQDSIDQGVYNEIRGMTMAELREYILSYGCTEAEIHRLSKGLTSEVIAGVCKLMSNLDLVYAANKVRVTATCNTTIGERGHMSTRLQPNHSTDNVEGITASLFEGLSYGCGDALLGLNPVNDTVDSLAEVLKRFDEVKNRFSIPTQICVLGHITTQIEAVKRGAPCDMIFQSIAGSEKGNRAFGFRQIPFGKPWRFYMNAEPRKAPMCCTLRQGRVANCPAMHITERIRLRWKPAVTDLPGNFTRLWSIQSSALSDRNIFTIPSRSSGRGWKIILWENCPVSRWAVTAATPII